MQIRRGVFNLQRCQKDIYATRFSAGNKLILLVRCKFQPLFLKGNSMKVFPLIVAGCAILLGGCASQPTGERIASADEQSYVPLGTSIPKRGPKSAEDKTLNLQQLENDRNMNNGTGAGH
jgi:hypothetical protein